MKHKQYRLEYAIAVIDYCHYTLSFQGAYGGYLKFEDYCEFIRFHTSIGEFSHEQGVELTSLCQQIRDLRNE
jgi:hypothetical protein